MSTFKERYKLNQARFEAKDRRKKEQRPLKIQSKEGSKRSKKEPRKYYKTVIVEENGIQHGRSVEVSKEEWYDEQLAIRRARLAEQVKLRLERSNNTVDVTDKLDEISKSLVRRGITITIGTILIIAGIALFPIGIILILIGIFMYLGGLAPRNRS